MGAQKRAALKDSPDFAAVPTARCSCAISVITTITRRSRSIAGTILPAGDGSRSPPREYGPSPWTSIPVRGSRRPANRSRILKGHPGSGKDHRAVERGGRNGAQRVLYVTYSRDLAALARDYFDRYCSSHKYFHVVTFRI